MSTDPAIPWQGVAGLLARLGYLPNAGWVPADTLDELATHRFAMQQARREMSVIIAFRLKHEGKGGDFVATPIVYVAAGDSASVKEIHRKVWSQGLVPFLLVLTPEANRPVPRLFVRSGPLGFRRALVPMVSRG